MKTLYSVGACPFCSNQGLIFPVRKNKKITFVCDEAYHVFEKFEDIAEKKLQPEIIMDEDYLELEEFLAEMPELKKEVFVFEDGNWRNMVDDTREIWLAK